MVARTIQFFYSFTLLCFILLLLLFFYALNKTPLGETGCLTSPYFFTGCSNIKFFDSPLSPFPFQSTVSQATLGNLQFTVENMCDLQDIMLQHWWPGTSQKILT